MNDFREYKNYLMHYGVKGMKWHDHVYKKEDQSSNNDNSNNKQDKTQSGSHWYYTGPSEDEKIKVEDQKAAIQEVNMYRSMGYTDDEIRQIFLKEANRQGQTPLGKRNYTYFARVINKIPRK